MRFISTLVLALAFGAFLSAEAAEDRISARIEGSPSVLVNGPLHPKATPDSDRGPLAPSVKISGITINVRLSASQQTGLVRLLEEQRDPSSPSYQKWLSPEEFGDRFGLSLSDMDKVTTWLRSHGFTVDHVSRSMNWIAFSGTAAQVDRAFNTELHRFLVEGESHFANTRQPAIPAALRDVVGDIQGLHDFRLKHTRVNAKTLRPDFTSGSTHYLAPGDMATIFNLASLYAAGFTGAGQNLVVAGQTDVSLSDIQTFRANFGLTATNLPKVILYGADPGTTGDQMEADLDLEWTGAIARDANIIYVNSSNVISSVQYAISQNLAPVISLSYGGCEPYQGTSMQSIAQQANAQGITWLASSGDSGAAACDSGATATYGLAVNVPASIPEVTGVGGSEFNEGGGAYWGATNNATGGSALSYIPEMAWNDSISRDSLSATGGGKSIYFAKPAWQTGAGVPADGARDVPDVSLPASPDHDGFLIYSSGSQWVVGGTSVSTPAFAGIVSLLNQYLLSKGTIGKVGLGNINPTLYHLSAATTNVFHDITVGSNIVPCSAGSKGCANGSLGYSTGPGYDQATGLGSVDAYNMVTLWSSIPASVSTTSALTTSPSTLSSTASTTLSATVKPATGTTAPTGTVTFTDGSSTLATVTLVASGASSTASVQVSGSSIPTGTSTVTAAYSGSSAFTGSNASTSVTVTAPAVATTTTVSASPASITTNGSTVITASVQPVSGTTLPAGSVTFLLSTRTLGTANLSRGSASLTVSGSGLATGSNIITATYSGSSSFTGSTATTTVTVTAPVATTTTVSTSSNANASPVLTATVTPVTGTIAPTGTVTFTLGNKNLGSANLTASGSSATATLTVKTNQLSAGTNTIKATYSGSAAFASSTGTVLVTAQR